jgi:hypothetical protein
MVDILITYLIFSIRQFHFCLKLMAVIRPDSNIFSELCINYFEFDRSTEQIGVYSVSHQKDVIHELFSLFIWKAMWEHTEYLYCSLNLIS